MKNSVILWFDKHYARFLTPADHVIIHDLDVRCADFFLLQSGEPPSLAESEKRFTEVPAGRDTKHLITLGIFTTDHLLVGIIQALRGYRKPGDWYIGEMLLDPAERNHGLGTMVHQSFAGWAKQQEVKRLLLAVLKENQSALSFWTRLGYKIIKEFPSRKIGRKEHQFIELEYCLIESDSAGTSITPSIDKEEVTEKK